MVLALIGAQRRVRVVCRRLSEYRHSRLPTDTNSDLPKDIAIKEIVMSAITANDLKTNGIKAIEDALLTQPEVSVSVRGQVKYVVMSQEHYHHLRECELGVALAESKVDMTSDCFVKDMVAQHLKYLKQLNNASK